MTERQIENRVKKLQELEAQVKALEAETETIKNILKAELEAQSLEELKTKSFIIRWKEVISNRLDSKTLKADLPDIYNKYCRSSSTKRFAIA